MPRGSSSFSTCSVECFSPFSKKEANEVKLEFQSHNWISLSVDSAVSKCLVLKAKSGNNDGQSFIANAFISLFIKECRFTIWKVGMLNDSLTFNLRSMKFSFFVFRNFKIFYSQWWLGLARMINLLNINFCVSSFWRLKMVDGSEEHTYFHHEEMKRLEVRSLKRIG